MKKEFKKTRMIHHCKKCQGPTTRSEKGYKIANIVMTISAVGLALSFFGLLAEEVASLALIFLVPSTAAVFYYLYGKKEGEFMCKDCGNKQTDEMK